MLSVADASLPESDANICKAEASLVFAHWPEACYWMPQVAGRLERTFEERRQVACW